MKKITAIILIIFSFMFNAHAQYVPSWHDNACSGVHLGGIISYNKGMDLQVGLAITQHIAITAGVKFLDDGGESLPKVEGINISPCIGTMGIMGRWNFADNNFSFSPYITVGQKKNYDMHIEPGIRLGLQVGGGGDIHASVSLINGKFFPGGGFSVFF